MPEGEFVRQVRASSVESHQYLEGSHPARNRYRAAALLVGLLLAALGVVALVIAGDAPFAGRSGHGFLGLILNQAGGVLLLAIAVAVVLAAAVGGNIGAAALTGVGIVILLLGLVILALSRTGANVVAFSVIDVCVLWVAGLGVPWCGMHTWDLEEHRTLLGAVKAEHQEADR